jgi:hypothetical protein
MGSGSTKVAAPDYTPLANASAQAATQSAELGQAQLDFAKQQYAEQQPLLQRIVDAQIGQMDATQQQGDDYYQNYVNTYRPLEDKMVADAQAFNTDAYREQLAQTAAADAAQAFSNTQGANERAMASMGVNPNSGKFASTQNQSALGLAAARTGTMNATRQQATATGYARQLDAVGLGKGLAGASTGAYSLALNSGNSAGANSSAAGSNYMAGMAQGIGTIQNGQRTQIGGLGSIVNSQAGIYNAQTQANGSSAAGLGSLAGTLGGIALGKYL